jgi:mono/diheme cytochrome c family protein
VPQQVISDRGAMPSFRSVLTHRQIEDVSSYVVHFLADPSSPTRDIG